MLVGEIPHFMATIACRDLRNKHVWVGVGQNQKKRGIMQSQQYISITDHSVKWAITKIMQAM